MRDREGDDVFDVGQVGRVAEGSWLHPGDLRHIWELLIAWRWPKEAATVMVSSFYVHNNALTAFTPVA